MIIDICFVNVLNAGEANKQRQAPPSRKAKKFKKVVAVDKDQGASQGKTLELYAEHLFVLIEAEELQYWLEVGGSLY